MTTKVTDKVVKRLKAPKATKSPRLVNHIALVIDESGSMSSFVQEVVNLVNDQLDNIRNESKEKNQDTFVTLRTFATVPGEYKPFASNVHNIGKWNQWTYRPSGQTALRDTLNAVIKDLNTVDNSQSTTTSFLIVVITDGEENASTVSLSTLKSLIQKVNGTDRWTIVCLVPPGHKNTTVKQLGVFPGNVKEWETSEKGFKEANMDLATGMKNYMTTRSTGLGATKTFYVDTSNLTDRSLDNLTDYQAISLYGM